MQVAISFGRKIWCLSDDVIPREEPGPRNGREYIVAGIEAGIGTRTRTKTGTRTRRGIWTRTAKIKRTGWGREQEQQRGRE